MAGKEKLVKELDKFMVTPEAEAELPIVPSAPEVLIPSAPAVTVVVAEVGPNPIMKVLADIWAIGMCAKDLHYRAAGTPFYSLHILADIMWDVIRESDDLIETYYLGENRSEPPMMEKIFQMAIDTCPAKIETKEPYAERLLAICHRTIDDVEEAKKMPEIKSGVHAVLDTISQKALVSVGLLSQTLKG